MFKINNTLFRMGKAVSTIASAIGVDIAEDYQPICAKHNTIDRLHNRRSIRAENEKQALISMRTDSNKHWDPYSDCADKQFGTRGF